MSDPHGERRHLEALGHIVAHATLVEDRLAVFLYKLISDDQIIGQIVVAELSFRARVALLEALAIYRIGDKLYLERLQTLLNEAVQADERRNTMVHSLWGETRPDGRMRYKVTAKKRRGLHWQIEHVVTEDLVRLGIRLSNLADSFDDLLSDLPSTISKDHS